MASNNQETIGTVGGAWLNAVLKLGVPSAIAIFMVWFMASSVMAGMGAQQTLLQHHDGRAEALQQRIERHVAEDEARTLEMRFLLRQICVNTSKSEAQKTACLSGM